MLGTPISKPLLRACLAAALLAAGPTAGAEEAAWVPRASERLVKLPPAYLKKAIDRDFADSPLAQATADTERRIGDKTRTLADLKDALALATGDTTLEVRHQLIAEKQAYVRLMSERQQLRRRQLDTRLRLYRALIGKLDRQAAATPAEEAVAQRHAEARQRLERTVKEIDVKLLAAGLAPESRYAKEHGRNLQAIEQLARAIEAHPANRAASFDPGLSRQDQVRALVAETEADLALLDQEETALGYMAKLVALDALAFADEVGGPADTGSVDGPAADIAAAAALFLQD